MQQVSGEVAQTGQMISPLICMGAQNHLLLAKLLPCICNLTLLIPGVPQATQRSGSRTIQLLAITLLQGIKLGPMRAFILWINVPDERACRPLRPNQRIFATYKIDIAGPQKPVIYTLLNKWQNLDSQRATLKFLPRLC